MALRLSAAAVTSLLLCGCEVYAVPSPVTCPGALQGTFDFVASQTVTPADCFFAQPSGPAYQVLPSFAFAGTISFATDGTTDAALCKSAPHAIPNLGTHAALVLDVASTFGLTVNGCTCASAEAAKEAQCGCPPDSPSSNCSCPVILEQRIQGDLLPIPGGYSGFQGTLTNRVLASPLATTTCDCQDPCSYAYTIAATTVGSR